MIKLAGGAIRGVALGVVVTALVQSLLAAQIFPLAHVVAGAHEPPQSTSVSLPFFMTSTQVGVVHTFVVAWQDYREGTGLSDIYGARVDGSGVLVDPQGFAIAAGPDEESAPVLVSMGGQSSLAVYVSSQFTAGTNTERVQARLVQMP